MWFKKGPKIGDFRIAEEFVPESNGYVYRVQRYDFGSGYDCNEEYWRNLQICSNMKQALDWVERYRKAADVKYHYI